MKKEFKKDRKRKIITFLVLSSLIVATVFLIIQIILDKKYDSNHVLALTQCIFGIFAFFLPNIISKKLKLEIPPTIYLAYIIFLYCSIILGEVRGFYYTVVYWDDLLHFFSGMMLGCIGFSIVELLNKNVKNLNLSPIFITIFSICFAVTIGVIWEIYEFCFDGLLSLNMQKFALNDGTNLVGRIALYDTMKDLIIDLCGASLMSLMGYLSIIKNKNWLNDIEIKHKK